jgi:alpha-L-rhamnosidase
MNHRGTEAQSAEAGIELTINSMARKRHANGPVFFCVYWCLLWAFRRSGPGRLGLRFSAPLWFRVGVCFGLIAAAAVADLRVLDPRCEYSVDPLGIDVPAPRLSWRVESAQRGQRQTAWQVLVASSPELLGEDRGDLWDSGRVESDETTHRRYAGAELRSSQTVHWKVRTWDRLGEPSSWSEPATWTMGLLAPDDWKARWILAPWASEALLLRQEFDVGSGLRRALLHVSGLGHYEAFLNGEKAGEDLFSPGWTNYDRTTLYDTRDVTALVREGRNAIGLSLGNGMYHVVRRNRFAKFVGSFGPLRAIAQLELEFADGSRKVIGTDDTWRVHRGAITYNSIYGGEDHDARLLPRGWNEPGFEADGWSRAKHLVRPSYTLRGHSGGSEPVRAIETRAPVEVRQLAPSVWLYDFGQNASFMPRLTVRGPSGSTVRLTPGEVVKEDGTIDRGTMGGAHRGSAWWQYTKGTDAEETWFPQFYYVGSRYLYVELEPPLREGEAPGATLLDMPRLGEERNAGNRSLAIAAPSDHSLTLVATTEQRPLAASHPQSAIRTPQSEDHSLALAATKDRSRAVAVTELPAIVSLEMVIVHAAAEPVGHFATSDPLLNRIRELVRWAQRSNMVSVLTDCPHREKLGWIEQYHLNGPSIRHEFDVARIYTKGMNDMAEAQTADGLIPNIAPEYTTFKGAFRGAAEWGAAFILVPWQQYQFNGDTELLRAHYGAMKRYFAYLESRLGDDGMLSDGLGDWYDLLLGKSGRANLTPAPITATAFLFYDAVHLAKIARVLGTEDDARLYEQKAAAVRQRYNEKFFNAAAGSYGTGSQASLALPLVMGIVDPEHRERVLARLVRDVEEKRYATAGDIGFRFLLLALAEGGRSDVIYRLINQDELPGYGYQLKQGATALTEAWDANRGASHNHFMLGQVIEWYYQHLAGIAPDPDGPGFRKTIIRPQPVGELDWVEASHRSMHGPITVRWERNGERIALNVTVPTNTTATVFIPSRQGAAINESGRAAEHSEGVAFVRRENDRAVYRVESGTYRFESRW